MYSVLLCGLSGWPFLLTSRTLIRIHIQRQFECCNVINLASNLSFTICNEEKDMNGGNESLQRLIVVETRKK